MVQVAERCDGPERGQTLPGPLPAPGPAAHAGPRQPHRAPERPGRLGPLPGRRATLSGPPQRHHDGRRRLPGTAQTVQFFFLLDGKWEMAVCGRLMVQYQNVNTEPNDVKIAVLGRTKVVVGIIVCVLRHPSTSATASSTASPNFTTAWRTCCASAESTTATNTQRPPR